MTNRNDQSAKQFVLTRNDGETAASAEHKYHVPESFRKCTVEIQGGGDGAGSGSHLCLTEAKGAHGRDKNLLGAAITASQVWIQKDAHKNCVRSVGKFTSR